MSVTFVGFPILMTMAFEITTVAAMADSLTLETTIDQLMDLVDAVLDSAESLEYCPI